MTDAELSPPWIVAFLTERGRGSGSQLVWTRPLAHHRDPQQHLHGA